MNHLRATSSRPTINKLTPSPRKAELDGIFLLHTDHVLGQGTYGMVMLATSHKFPGIEMVCKRISIEKDWQLREFEREARNQLLMSGPGFAVSPQVYYLKCPPPSWPCFGYIIQEKFTMNLMQYHDLIIHRFGALFALEILKLIATLKLRPLMRQMLIANLIHYDLKPNNIMVRLPTPVPEANTPGVTVANFPLPELSIIDFGMAQDYSSDWTITTGKNQNCSLRLLNPPMKLYDWAFAQYCLNVCIAKSLGIFLMNLAAERRVDICPHEEYEKISQLQIKHEWPWKEYHSARLRDRHLRERSNYFH